MYTLCHFFTLVGFLTDILLSADRYSIEYRIDVKFSSSFHPLFYLGRVGTIVFLRPLYFISFYISIPSIYCSVFFYFYIYPSSYLTLVIYFTLDLSCGSHGVSCTQGSNRREQRPGGGPGEAQGGVQRGAARGVRRHQQGEQERPGRPGHQEQTR